MDLNIFKSDLSDKSKQKAMTPKISFNLPLLPLLLLAFSLTSCMSPQKLVEQGNYDKAIVVGLKKVRGKDNKNPKHVQAIETAFRMANGIDLKNIERMKLEGQPDNWTKINAAYRKIQRRQDKIERYLPLIDKNGYRAYFDIVNVDALEIESREKAAQVLYAKAERNLERAGRGDKLAARMAYQQLGQIDQYFRTFRDKERLKDEALELGRSYILYEVSNKVPFGAIKPIEDELRSFPVSNLNSIWLVYHSRKRKGVDYDYVINLNLANVQISPELVDNREYIDSREIEDGWEYELDENGNVKKDSSGNDIKIPKIVEIKARVLETYQHKSVVLQTRLEVKEYRTGELLRTIPITAEVVFENYAATFVGDERALSKESRRKIGNQPVPFPPNTVLLLEAANKIKPSVRGTIRDTRDIM